MERGVLVDGQRATEADQARGRIAERQRDAVLLEQRGGLGQAIERARVVAFGQHQAAAGDVIAAIAIGLADGSMVAPAELEQEPGALAALGVDVLGVVDRVAEHHEAGVAATRARARALRIDDEDRATLATQLLGGAASGEAGTDDQDLDLGAGRLLGPAGQAIGGVALPVREGAGARHRRLLSTRGHAGALAGAGA